MTILAILVAPQPLDQLFYGNYIYLRRRGYHNKADILNVCDSSVYFFIYDACGLNGEMNTTLMEV